MAIVSVRPRRVTAGLLRRWLPERKRNAHKGDFGRVLLLCGAPETVYPIIAAKLDEPVVFPLPAREGRFSAEAIPEILRRLERSDACLIGCGMGSSGETFEVVRAVLEHAACPVVVDADGINVLQGHIDVLRGAACPVILTPHDGEFRRLGGTLEGRSRVQAARELSQTTGATILLKGHRTVVYGPEGCYVNCTGNPGMATGGSGDVLAGIIVSLLGQGLRPVQAAAAGAWLHGAAGDRCARRLGEYGLLPTDILEELPRLLR